jgi:hypothetical protein
LAPRARDRADDWRCARAARTPKKWLHMIAAQKQRKKSSSINFLIECIGRNDAVEH